jgi:Fe2+ or Zn2+ uptake regulation protein
MENRNTIQKNIVLNQLMIEGHPTASELYESIHKTHPKISRATVFRILGQFADSGKIRRIELLGSDTRFDANMKPHAHCHCIKCGRVEDVWINDFDYVLSEKQVNDFKILSVNIEFNGLCSMCQNKEN